MITEKPKLKLTRTDGNAFAIISRARVAGRKAGWTKEQLDAFSKEAMSGNYDHVLQTCCEYFDVR